jgi:hypothetical protein
MFIIKVFPAPDTFDNAEMGCLPFPANSPYRKQMMWSENPLHLDFVARMVNETHGTHEYWVGLDNKIGGVNWTTRYVVIVFELCRRP